MNIVKHGKMWNARRATERDVDFHDGLSALVAEDDVVGCLRIATGVRACFSASPCVCAFSFVFFSFACIRSNKKKKKGGRCFMHVLPHYFECPP